MSEFPSLYRYTKKLLGVCLTQVTVGELKVNKQRTTEMQWERTYKEFFDLITETYEQHKRKPQDLEKALRKVIKREKEVLEKSQGQDRFV